MSNLPKAAAGHIGYAQVPYSRRERSSQKKSGARG
jgi:hypothetical protein